MDKTMVAICCVPTVMFGFMIANMRYVPFEDQVRIDAYKECIKGSKLTNSEAETKMYFCGKHFN